MTFVNLSLLAGSALIVLPIVLHLIMRRKPTLLEFPALRFIQKRHDTNRRRMRWRHLLLLLLRAGVIALLALALARPSVKLGGRLGSQEAPVAAAMLFDTAPHMEYRRENQTRLQAAKELGAWLTAQLPEQSEIAVLDTRLGATPAFQADRGAAKDRIERLETVANSQSLPMVLDAAVPLLQQSELPRKEVYLFTDLSHGAWPAEQSARLQEQLDALGDVGVYVIDVGVSNPTNCSLGEMRLSGEVLPNLSDLRINTEAICNGAAGQHSVELDMLDADGSPRKQNEQTFEAIAGEGRPLEFRVPRMAPGVHQGLLRIVGQDGLAADDTRFFTVEIKPAARVLLVAPRPAEDYAFFLSEALAPSLAKKRGQPSRFECDVCDQEALTQRSLTEYAAVCLLDPMPMTLAIWKKLVDYAAEGHGVGLFLGRNATPVDSFNGDEAQNLLPGKLTIQARWPDGDVYLSPRYDQHPIFALPAFGGHADAVPWMESPVFLHWELADVHTGVVAAATYSNGRPALLERTVGRGRCLTMTTPVSDRTHDSPWNFLPIGWPFMPLANQSMAYLTGGSETQLNYYAGQTAVLPLDAAAQRQSYLLSTPGSGSFPIPAELNRRELTITATDQVGNYRVRGGGSGGVDLGFSVNYAADQTRLDRLTDAELKEVFGPHKFRLARTREQIDRDISVARVGRELYPPLIVLVALLLALELMISNRFYKEAHTPMTNARSSLSGN